MLGKHLARAARCSDDNFETLVGAPDNNKNVKRGAARREENTMGNFDAATDLSASIRCYPLFTPEGIK